MFSQVSASAGRWGKARKSGIVAFSAVLSLSTSIAAQAAQTRYQALPPRQQVPVLRLSSVPHAKEVIFPASGIRTVVSFVSLRADEPTGVSSRGQIAILESLRHQVKPASLQVVVIGYAGAGKQPSFSEATNAWYDWHLVGIPLLVDRSEAAARAYRVVHAPTTFIVAANGRVLRRWDGFVAPGPLELAVTPRPH